MRAKLFGLVIAALALSSSSAWAQWGGGYGYGYGYSFGPGGGYGQQSITFGPGFYNPNNWGPGDYVYPTGGLYRSNRVYHYHYHYHYDSTQRRRR